ncbi:MAG: dinitrogenase iron-molybdenum cofactor biosynthesis protein [Chlorobiaceae bacterium]|nr:dinitrogenase iron-molybdenum cofactor biosynthesis protein [Chlorobiaceae bacterium]NTV59713.1 dinitrogenase iron-molybdenum cofactor biosynthesis protein [Chlorobiaceae bacterium]
MKVLIPVEKNEGAGSKMCEHFGSAPCFAVADTVNGSFEIIANAGCNHDHGQCLPADASGAEKVDAVICKGIGGRAAAHLGMSGIDIYMASSAGTASEALELFKNGLLFKADLGQTCAGHGCH